MTSDSPGCVCWQLRCLVGVSRVPGPCGPQRGTQRVLEEEKSMNQVYGVPDGVMLHFRLHRAHADTVPEMARYYVYARDAILTELDGERYVSLFLDHKASQNYIQRARSFGWTPVEWRAGLPPAPIRVVTRRTPVGPKRIGRPFEWLQTVIFDIQPTDEQVAEIVRIAEPSRERNIISAATSCGKWEVSLWRDRGWTRTEHAAFWQQVHELGGREVQTGDFGCNEPNLVSNGAW